MTQNSRAARLSTQLLLALVVMGVFGTSAAHEGHQHAPAGAADAPLSPDARSVLSTLENYAAAIESKDLSRVKPLLVAGDEFSYFEGAFANFGWRSYYEHLAPEMALFDKPSYRLTDIEPFVSGDLAFATFAWAMEVTVVSDKFEGGRHPVSMNGRGTAVLIRQAGAWKIRHLHTAQAPAKRAGSPGSH
jgi:ketosteroid isomerase-like protein